MDYIKSADRNGVHVNPGEEYDHPYPWAELGSLNTEITTPSATGRDRMTIAALVAIGSVLELLPPKNVWKGPQNEPAQPNGAVSYEIRTRSDGDENGSYVVDILAAAGPLATEHYTRKSRLTSLQGAQAATVGYFHDVFAETEDAWFDEADRVIPITARENYIGSYIFNVSGLLSIIFAPITIPTGATLYIDYRRFS
jgi:hypothetical protein